MKIDITFSQDDVAKVREIITRMAGHAIVVDRQQRNIERRDIELSHTTIWERQIGCLLTTRQKSSENSAVQRFIQSGSPLLSLCQCERTEDVTDLATSELSKFGGIRRTTVIPKQIAYNFRWLTAGGWNEIDALLAPLGKAPQPKETERACASGIDRLLKGFGPKQSRNLLQWLGLTQYEIPIDSRILKWLKILGDGHSLDLLSSVALGETEYYCCILDKIQDLCAEAEAFPCIFDASVFASFEKS